MKQCKKKAFKDKRLATIAMHLIQNRDDGKKKPIRTYQCDDCGDWHLTSKAIDDAQHQHYKLKLDWSRLIQQA